jgi:UDP-2,4-diacetamido-2,4,6-trideoxy-beta-L-altropyranose hydrolase
MGHLERSLALATALRRRNIESVFLTNEDSRCRERVQRFGFSASALSRVESWTPEDLKLTLKLALQCSCDAVLMDSHEVTADYLAQLRGAGLFVAARDDLALYPFPCQIVFNGNADASQLPYRSSSGDTAFLLGPRYMVLKEEYWSVPPRAVQAKVENILVTVGGADQHNLVPRLLAALDSLPGDFEVTAVIGPFFQNVASIKAAARDASRPVKLVHQPDSIHNLMLEADLAVSAGGQTLYELASIGCPTVAIKVASNQDGQMRALAKAGCIRHAGDAARDKVVTAVAQALVSLLPDTDARAAMVEASQKLVDGRGALRVADEIIKEVQIHTQGHADSLLSNGTSEE